MRKAFVETVSNLLDTNENIVLLLGDISVHAFRDAKAKHPMRVINCGVSEQAMVSAGAGLARAGMYPIMHTIAPFLVERAFEQIKVDFGYQELPGCFVSIGASYDYGGMGCTHHCPGDVAALLTIPGMEVFAPHHGAYVKFEIEEAVQEGRLRYVRLSDAETMPGTSTSVHINSNGSRDTFVVPLGPTWDLVPPDASTFYVDRLDRLDIGSYQGIKRLLVIEPFYVGTMAHAFADALPGAIIKSVGIPRRFLRGYGTRDYFNEACGLTPQNVAEQLEALIRG